MHRLPLIILSALLAACGPRNEVANNVSNESTDLAVDDAQQRPLPIDASAADKSLILEWFEANDGCQGGINVSIDDPICKTRDTRQDDLRTRGWCWGAPLKKTAADSNWHHCGEYDTDNSTNLDADVQRGRESLGSVEKVQPSGVGDPRAGDWSNEKERPKSALLQAYENAVEPIDQKIGLANVLTKCGIRGPDWHQQMIAILENRKRLPTIEEMRQRLSRRDAASAKRFDQIVIDGNVNFILGGTSEEAACRGIANAPFAANDATFQR